MTLESLLEEIHDRGWYLYRMSFAGEAPAHPDPWTCHLRNANLKLIAYGQGQDPVLALERAIESMDSATPDSTPAPRWTKSDPPALADLLKSLAPPASAPPIRRRV